MKHLVQRRITWLLNGNKFYLMSSWAFGRGGARLTSLRSSLLLLEDAKVNQQTIGVVFLDVCRAYHFLPRGTILRQLQLNDVQERLLAFRSLP